MAQVAPLTRQELSDERSRDLHDISAKLAQLAHVSAWVCLETPSSHQPRDARACADSHRLSASSNRRSSRWYDLQGQGAARAPAQPARLSVPRPSTSGFDTPPPHSSPAHAERVAAPPIATMPMINGQKMAWYVTSCLLCYPCPRRPRPLLFPLAFKCHACRVTPVPLDEDPDGTTPNGRSPRNAC